MGNPRHAYVKNIVKTNQGSTTLRENAIPKHETPKFHHTFFFKIYSEYELNLCRYLNPELPPMREFASLIIGKYCTFVCETLFGGYCSKVQHLPSIRDAKSQNILFYNSTVRTPYWNFRVLNLVHSLWSCRGASRGCPRTIARDAPPAVFKAVAPRTRRTDGHGHAVAATRY